MHRLVVLRVVALDQLDLSWVDRLDEGLEVVLCLLLSRQTRVQLVAVTATVKLANPGDKQGQRALLNGEEENKFRGTEE